MLLADWVFEQAPKAITQLVELLSTPTNMQRLLSPRRYAGQDIVTLPPLSGGRKIFESAFALLESSDTPADRRRTLASLALSQSSADECDRRWPESPTYASNPAIWLQIGRNLGALSRAPGEVLKAKLENIALNRAMATVLLQTGRSECVLSSGHSVQLLQNVLLSSRHYYVRPTAPQAPFYLLDFVLAQAPHNLQCIPEAQRELISSFKNTELSEADKQRQVKFPLIMQAYELSLELSRGFTEAATGAQ
ncbi:hypothetical protein [Bradyrhizobium elkanii]|uniref:Uncharacterized protein n=1 Tax=Bradyrhizobium elkanii TaxID=29448 RepID=A0A8I1YGZ9_BRAEL|nr:hypothetical protein [Bradyrhizobium elkanii]MBP1299770.1 hypothetical protein [Bradyrhizobium elkanii]